MRPISIHYVWGLSSDQSTSPITGFQANWDRLPGSVSEPESEYYYLFVWSRPGVPALAGVPVHPVPSVPSELLSGNADIMGGPDSSSLEWHNPQDWLSPSSPGGCRFPSTSQIISSISCPAALPKSSRRAGGRSSRPPRGGADPPRCPHTWRGTRGCCCACPSS